MSGGSISSVVKQMIEAFTGKGGGGSRNTIRMPTGQSFNPDTYKPARENMKKGGIVSSASKRADGCAIRGKTKGRIV